MSAMSLVTRFGTRMLIRNPEVSEHAWGETVEGWAQVEGRLGEEYVTTRLETARDVRWWPDEPLTQADSEHDLEPGQ
jgi:hypothetical protein